MTRDLITSADPRAADVQVRCLDYPTAEQLDAVAAYTAQRLRRWQADRHLLPETHVVAGIQIKVERKP